MNLNKTPGEHFLQMLCPFQGKQLKQIPITDLQLFSMLKRERAKKTGRIYQQHVKEDLDAIDAYVESKRKHIDKLNLVAENKNEGA